MTKRSSAEVAVAERQHSLAAAAAQLAERLVAEGKILPADRARIRRMCRSSASFRATADYFDAQPAKYKPQAPNG